uniref:Uncharacterized protein n=1 Tax=uncultured marine virus TaxID=186617 RepID=A0A0F7L5F0_9VIRU|nr:hypothetical protein [uncultured marine virus]
MFSSNPLVIAMLEANTFADCAGSTISRPRVNFISDIVPPPRATPSSSPTSICNWCILVTFSLPI